MDEEISRQDQGEGGSDQLAEDERELWDWLQRWAVGRRNARAVDLISGCLGSRWNRRRILRVAARLRERGRRVAGARSAPCGLYVAADDAEWADYLARSGRTLARVAAIQAAARRRFREQRTGQLSLSLPLRARERSGAG